MAEQTNIATQIARIKSDRDTIRTKLVNLGLANGTSNLDELASAVESIEKVGTVSAEVKEGETYSIPKGYHDGSGTVSGVKGGGNYKLQSKTITPTKKQETVTPDEGNFGLSDVVVNAIPDNYQDVSSVTATAADVLANKLFVTKEGELTPGTMINNGAIVHQFDGLNVASYTIPEGYTTGGTISLTDDIENELASI